MDQVQGHRDRSAQPRASLNVFRCQWCGRSSFMRRACIVGRRSSTSFREAYGSCPLSRAECTRLMIAAARLVQLLGNVLADALECTAASTGGVLGLVVNSRRGRCAGSFLRFGCSLLSGTFFSGRRLSSSWPARPGQHRWSLQSDSSVRRSRLRSWPQPGASHSLAPAALRCSAVLIQIPKRVSHLPSCPPILYVDTILHVATVKFKMGSPDPYAAPGLSPLRVRCCR